MRRLRNARRAAQTPPRRSGRASATRGAGVAIILGSGLGGLADEIDRSRGRIPYREVPGFPPATVVGHAGALIAGTLGGTRVVALAGRFHMYEGHDAGARRLSGARASRARRAAR